MPRSTSTTPESRLLLFSRLGASGSVSNTSLKGFVADSPACPYSYRLTDCITSQNMLTRFPRIKLYNQFEYEKTETANDGSDDLRDYRVLNNTAVLDELKADLNSLSGSFYWAASRAPPTSISSAGAPAATNSGRFDRQAGHHGDDSSPPDDLPEPVRHHQRRYSARRVGRTRHHGRRRRRRSVLGHADSLKRSASTGSTLAVLLRLSSSSCTV